MTINLRQDAPDQVDVFDPTELSEAIEQLKSVGAQVLAAESKLKELKAQEKYIVDDSINLPVQVNGKLRANIEVAKDIDKDSLLELIQQNNQVIKFTSEKELVKFIYVPGKIANLVVK